MKVSDILLELASKDIELRLDNQEELAIRARKGTLNEILKNKIVSHKQDIIRLMQNNAVVSTKEKQVLAFQQSVYPLSYGQERILFYEMLYPQTATYNVPYVVKLGEKLDANKLENTFLQLIKKHSALRTGFELKNNVPHQIILPQLSQKITVTFYGNIEDEQRIAEVVNDEVTRPFYLQVPPLARLALIHISGEQSLVCLVLHHIICDAWSLPLLLADFQKCYFGESLSIKPSDLNMGDVALYERSWLSTIGCQRELNYWLERLKGYPPSLEFKKSGAYVKMEQQGDNYYFSFPTLIHDALIRYADEFGISIADILFAAYAVLLGAITKKDKIIIGMAVTLRDKEELTKLVGFAVNTLPIPINLASSSSSAEFLTYCHNLLIETLDNKNVPFDLIVAKLGLQRTLEETPLIQAMFSYHESNYDKKTWLGASCIQIETNIRRSKTDLTAGFYYDGIHIRAGFEFATSLFSRADMQNLAKNYQTLLYKMLTNKALAINTLCGTIETYVQIGISRITDFTESSITEMEGLPTADTIKDEANLLSIMRELLGSPAISRHCNFFEAGGNSLTAIRFVAKAREVGININIKHVFKYQTVAKMCANREA